MYQYVSQSATTTQVITDIVSDSLLTLTIAIGLVLGVAVFLVGVGFGWRKLVRYVTGRKF